MKRSVPNAGGGYGPNPWRQTQWDARAAANFMCGGAGGGLLFCGALLAAGGAPQRLWISCALLGLALVGAGLTAVWFEIGRPLRAFNVMFNPRTSWMTRESIVATLLIAATLLLLLARSAAHAMLPALLALAFVFAQGRILHASKGIPAWHDALVPPWIVATGLSEGAGIAVAIAVLAGVTPPAWAGAALVAALLARAALWRAYRESVSPALAPGAALALDSAGRALLLAGTLAPVLLVLGAVLPLPGSAIGDLAMIGAGAFAWFGGWAAKYLLVCRACFNRGFSIAHLPVRGRR